MSEIINIEAAILRTHVDMNPAFLLWIKVLKAFSKFSFIIHPNMGQKAMFHVVIVFIESAVTSGINQHLLCSFIDKNASFYYACSFDS